jgi:hypothetical protein
MLAGPMKLRTSLDLVRATFGRVTQLNVLKSLLCSICGVDGDGEIGI